jgi:hypothetical protein
LTQYWFDFMPESLNCLFRTSFIAMVFAWTPVAASDECTFSELGMLDEVKRIASANPGATIDPENLRATWEVGDGTVEYFEAGGCHDYGKAAGSTTKSTEPRDASAVLKVAVELAHKFMATDNLKLVSDAVEVGAIERGENSENDYQFISHPFGEIVISHRFSNGVDTVEISWPVL